MTSRVSCDRDIVAAVFRSTCVASIFAFALGGCTLAFPAVGVWRANHNADVTLDEHGCMASASGSGACVHPQPVEYGSTIVANALVGLVIDAAVLAISAHYYLPNFGNGDLFPG